MNDRGLADADAANPFRLRRLHPGNGRPPRRRGAAAGRQWALSLPYHLRYLLVWDDGTPISRMPTGVEPRDGLRDGLLVMTVRVLSSRHRGGALSMRYLEGERDIRVSAPGASGFR